MSKFLRAVRAQAQAHPDRRVYATSSGQQLTYGQLWTRSDALAAFLAAENAQHSPVVLMGHKEPNMLVGMLACMKAGCPYVPVDSGLPVGRVANIISQLDEPFALQVGPDASFKGAAPLRTVSRAELDAVCAHKAQVDEDCWVSGEDAQYILFTSGSTGTPKGVVCPARAIDHTYRYFEHLIPEGEGLVFFNRANFSFDLSLFDIAMALPFGHQMFAFDAADEQSMARMFQALGASGVNVWVSTPSYLELCLTDPSFSPELLPQVSTFVMCGETLPRSTAAKLLERFGGAKLYNMYGPTETQAAISDVLVTPAMAQAGQPLPVGTPSPFAQVLIQDLETHAPLPAGEEGEIVIAGQTVALGYYKRPEQTAAVFGTCAGENGAQVPFYRTGDGGYLDAQGMLHYLGRFDTQVKVNGFRIELEEIEQNLVAYPQVQQACVVPVTRRGAAALAAHVVLKPGVQGDRALTRELKEALKVSLPAYMIPRTFTYHDALPLNVNGKIDRKALSAQGSTGGGR